MAKCAVCHGPKLTEQPCPKCGSQQNDGAFTLVDRNGHGLGCPAYNQTTFTICTCGAAKRAGL